jgi:hypothetical protein
LNSNLPVHIYSFANDAFYPLRRQFEESLGCGIPHTVLSLEVEKSIGVQSIEVWCTKTQHIIDAIKAHFGYYIIFSDIDVCFHKPLAPFLLKCLCAEELYVQFEEPDVCCIGFMAIQCSERTASFFEEVLIQSRNGRHDQSVINDKLRKGDLRWAYFPDQVWGWHPSRSVPPDDIVLHHATFALSLEDKLTQLNAVSDFLSASYSKREHIRALEKRYWAQLGLWNWRRAADCSELLSSQYAAWSHPDKIHYIAGRALRTSKPDSAREINLNCQAPRPPQLDIQLFEIELATGRWKEALLASKLVSQRQAGWRHKEKVRMLASNKHSTLAPPTSIGTAIKNAFAMLIKLISCIHYRLSLIYIKYC